MVNVGYPLKSGSTCSEESFQLFSEARCINNTEIEQLYFVSLKDIIHQMHPFSIVI